MSYIRAFSPSCFRCNRLYHIVSLFSNWRHFYTLHIVSTFDPLMPFLTDFDFNLISSFGVGMATPAFFGPHCMEYPIVFLTFNLCKTLEVKWVDCKHDLEKIFWNYRDTIFQIQFFNYFSYMCIWTYEHVCVCMRVCLCVCVCASSWGRRCR